MRRLWALALLWAAPAEAMTLPPVTARDAGPHLAIYTTGLDVDDAQPFDRRLQLGASLAAGLLSLQPALRASYRLWQADEFGLGLVLAAGGRLGSVWQQPLTFTPAGWGLAGLNLQVPLWERWTAHVLLPVYGDTGDGWGFRPSYELPYRESRYVEFFVGGHDWRYEAGVSTFYMGLRL